MENKIQKSELFVIFILLILSFIYRMIFLYTPFDRDEGTYAYIADRMGNGELPYRDIVDHKQPFIYYIYKTAFDFLGKSDEAVRIFTNFYTIITFLVFYSFIRIFFNKWLSLLALFIFITHQNNHNLQGLNSNAEIFLVLPVLIAFIFLCSADKKYFKLNLFFTGFFLGIAIFIKLMTVFILFVPVFYILLYIKKNKIKYLFWFFLGFSVLCFLLLIWTLKNNMLKEFLEFNFFYNLFYLSRYDFKNIFFTIIKGGGVFIKSNLLLLLGFLYSFYIIFKNKKNEIIFISVASVILFYISIFLLSGLYPHYYLVLIPFLSILSAILINDIYFFLFKKTKNKKLSLIIIIIIIIVYQLYYLKINNVFAFIKSDIKTMNIFYEAKVIAEIININKKENQTVFVYTDEPEIYFYTQTKSPFKFIYNYPEYFKDFNLDKILSFDFLVLEKNNTLNKNLDKNFKKIVEFKNLILYKKEGDKNEENK